MVKKFILAVQTVMQADRISEENSNRRRSTKDELRRSSVLSLVTGADTSLGITSNQCEGVLRVLSQPQSERNEPELTTLVPWLKSRSEIFNKCDRGKIMLHQKISLLLLLILIKLCWKNFFPYFVSHSTIRENYGFYIGYDQVHNYN